MTWRFKKIFEPVSFSALNSLQKIPGFLQSVAVGVEDGLVDPVVSQPHQGLDVVGGLGEFETIDQGEMGVSRNPGVDLNEAMERNGKLNLVPHHHPVQHFHGFVLVNPPVETRTVREHVLQNNCGEGWETIWDILLLPDSPQPLYPCRQSD